jgi:DprA winged helix domain
LPFDSKPERAINEIQVDTALGQAVWSMRGQVRSPVLHWVAHGRLIAVAETSTQRFGIRKDISMRELDTMHAIERLPSAGDIPLEFRHSTLDWVLWRYARYADSSFAELPERFMSNAITVLRQPPVPDVWISAAQRAILLRLTNGPVLFDELVAHLKLNTDTLMRELVGLYFTRSIHAAKKSKTDGGNWSVSTFKGWVSSQIKSRNSNLHGWTSQ